MEHLLDRLREEKDEQRGEGVYEWLQTMFAFHSCRIEGNKTGYQDIRRLFRNKDKREEENTFDHTEIIEHFQLFDEMLDSVGKPLSLEMLQSFHRTFRDDTEDYLYKNNCEPGTFRSEEGDKGCAPSDIAEEMDRFMADYKAAMHSREVTIGTAAQFHLRFERIHPLPDDNGSMGRILLVKQCLEAELAPAIPGEDRRLSYLAAFTAEDPLAAMTEFLKKEQVVYERALHWMLS